MSDAIFVDGARYVSTAEAAAAESCSAAYVALLCRQGKVRARSAGRQWYVDPLSLRQFLAEQQELKEQRYAELSAHLRAVAEHTRPAGSASRLTTVLSAIAVIILLPAALTFAFTAETHPERLASLAAAAGSLPLDAVSAVQQLFNIRAGNAIANSQPAAVATAFSNTSPAPSSPSVAAPAIEPPLQTAMSFEPGPVPSVINHYVTQPIERIVEPQQLASADFVTQQELSAQLFQLSNALSAKFSASPSTTTIPQYIAAGGNFTSYAPPIVPAIDNLSNVTISSPTISGGSVSAGSVTGTITNAINSALATIDALSGTTLTYTGASSTNATSTDLYAANLSAGTLTVSSTSTLAGLALSNANCSGYGNGGKLTTDASGNVACAADQGGAGGTVGGTDTQVQFNSGGSFSGSSSFTFASSTNLLTVTSASTTNLTASYASTTNLVASAAFTLGNLNGFLKAANGVVSTSSINLGADVSGVLPIASGGTGTSTAPSYGQLLVGNSSGGYSLMATSSLGLSGGGGGSASSTLLTDNNTFAGSNTFSQAIIGSVSGNAGTATKLQTARTINGVSFDGSSNITLNAASSTLLGDNDIWSALQTFNGGASTTNLSASVEGYFGSASTTNLIISGISGSTQCLHVDSTGHVTGTGSDCGSGGGGAVNSVSNSDGTLTISPTSGAVVASLNLAHRNWWTGTQNFTDASTSELTATSTVWFTSLPSALLATDQNGKLIGTTTIGTNLLSGSLGTINGTSLAAGAAITVTAASSTLLGDNDTFSGSNTFSQTITGSVSGNASTATKLQIARTINGVSFDGSSNVVVTAASSTLLGDSNVFSGVDTFSNAASDFAGTWQGLSPSHFQSAGTYLTALGNYATTTGTAISISTSTLSWNGLTLGNTFSVSANGITVTPTVSGTLNNSGLTNSTISGVSLGSNLANLTATDNTLTFSGAYNGGTARTVGLNLANGNSWTGLQRFANASSTLFSAYGPAYFGGSATSSFNSAGQLTLANLASAVLGVDTGGQVVATTSIGVNYLTGTLPVVNGGTGSTTLTGILKGNGTSGVQTAVGGTDYEFPLTFSTGLNRSGNTITNTGLLSLGSGFATTTGTSIALSTTTQSFNGLMIAQGISSPNGGDILFTPSISGTLNNSGLTNSTISGVALGSNLANLTATDNTLTLSGAYNGGTPRTVGLNVGNGNSWTALQQFNGAASTTLFSAYGPSYFGATATSSFNTSGQLTLANLASVVLGVNSSGQVVATTTIGTNLLTANTISGVALGGTLFSLLPNSTLSGSSYNGSAGVSNWGLNLGNTNWWTASQNFTNASTSEFTATSSVWFTNLTSALLAVDTNGKLIATTTIGTNLLSANSVTVSAGSGLSGGGAVSLGGSTSLSLNTGNANTWTALQQFNGAASSTLFSAYGPAYFGATATSSFDASGNLNLASGDSYKINGTSVLSGATLGGGVTGSSLTSVGTLIGGTWNASVIATAYGGTGTSTWQTGSIPFYNGTNFTENNAKLFWDNANSRLGIGSSTPGSLLSIQGIANWTTATSTYYSTGGINLTGGGCFSINGTCVGGGSGSSASSTLLSDNNTFSGNNTFTKLLALNGAASSTLFSAYGPSYFGATATSSFATNGALTLATQLTVPNGGTGQTSFTSGQLLYGVGAGALQSVATSSLSVGSTLSVSTGSLGYQIGGSNAAIGLNLAQANTWTGLQQFTANASTTNFSDFGTLWVGGTATSTIQGSTTGTSTIQGFLNVTGTNSTSTFSGGLAATYLNLTGSSATSTAANGINLSGGCFSVGGTCLPTNASQLTNTYTVDSGSDAINVGDIVEYINGNARKDDSLSTGTNAFAIGTTTAIVATSSSDYVTAADLDSSHFVMTFTDTNAHPYAVVCSMSNNSISCGTPVMLTSSTATYNYIAALSSTSFVVAFDDVTNTALKAVVGTVSGTTITLGSVATLQSSVSPSYNSVAALSPTSFVVAYIPSNPTAVVATVSGTTITGGTPVTLASVSANNTSVAALNSTNFVVSYIDGSNSRLAAIVCGASGTTISLGSPTSIVAGTGQSSPVVAALSSTSFVIGEDANSNEEAVVGSVSGTSTISASGGLKLITGNTSGGYTQIIPLNSTSFMQEFFQSSTVGYEGAIGTVSGTNITFTNLSPVASLITSPSIHPPGLAELDSSHVAVVYAGPAAGAGGPKADIAVPIGSTVLGMATDAANANGNVTVATDGIVTGLSGLTAGSTYYWNPATGLSTTTSSYQVGMAISSTAMLLNSNKNATSDQFFGDAVFANNFRITEAPGSPEGLIFENQLGRQIASLDENGNWAVQGLLQSQGIASTTLQNLLATSTAQATGYDFVGNLMNVIGQRLQTLAFGTSTSSPPALEFATSTSTMTPMDSFAASFLQSIFGEMIQWFASAANGIGDFFAENGHFSNELCVGKSGGEVCVTGDQLAAVLAATGSSASSTSLSASSSPPQNLSATSSKSVSSSTSPAINTPPQIQINGNNPAIIQVGTTYADLGATITGPNQDLNLGIKTFLNGSLTSNIVIDTSQAATDTIDYVVIDQNGLTATSTRTVIVEPTALTAPAVTTLATSSDVTATDPTSTPTEPATSTAATTATTTIATSTTP